MAITITDFENIGAIALPAVSAAGNVRIVFDVADNLLKMSQNGAAYVPFGTSVTGGGWTDDGTNVRLTTSTDSVSVGTTTPPAAGTKMSVQADVAPSGGPPSIVDVISLDGNVTGATTVLTGAGVGFRVDNAVGTLQTIARLGALYTDVTVGAEIGGIGFLTMYLGAAPALTVSFGSDGLGVFDVTGAGSTPQIQLNADIGGTAPAMRLGTGAAPTDWGLTRIGAGVSSVDGLRFDGSLAATAVEITSAASPYSPPATVWFILADPTAGNIIVNLPAVASSRGRMFTICHSTNSANTVSVTPNGGDTIDLVAAATVLTAQQSMSILAQPTGANWKIW